MDHRKIVTVHGVTNIVTCDPYGNNSIAFVADLPRDAVVDDVIVNGKRLADLELTEIEREVRVFFPRDLYFEGQRVVAVFTSSGGCELWFELRADPTVSFDVEYHEIAVTRI